MFPSPSASMAERPNRHGELSRRICRIPQMLLRRLTPTRYQNARTGTKSTAHRRTATTISLKISFSTRRFGSRTTASPKPDLSESEATRNRRMPGEVSDRPPVEGSDETYQEHPDAGRELILPKMG